MCTTYFSISFSHGAVDGGAVDVPQINKCVIGVRCGGVEQKTKKNYNTTRHGSFSQQFSLC